MPKPIHPRFLTPDHKIIPLPMRKIDKTLRNSHETLQPSATQISSTATWPQTSSIPIHGSLQPALPQAATHDVRLRTATASDAQAKPIGTFFAAQHTTQVPALIGPTPQYNEESGGNHFHARSMLLPYYACLPISDQCRVPIASPPNSYYLESQVPRVHLVQCQSQNQR